MSVAICDSKLQRSIIFPNCVRHQVKRRCGKEVGGGDVVTCDTHNLSRARGREERRGEDGIGDYESYC